MTAAEMRPKGSCAEAAVSPCGDTTLCAVIQVEARPVPTAWFSLMQKPPVST